MNITGAATVVLITIAAVAGILAWLSQQDASAAKKALAEETVAREFAEQRALMMQDTINRLDMAIANRDASHAAIATELSQLRGKLQRISNELSPDEARCARAPIPAPYLGLLREADDHEAGKDLPPASHDGANRDTAVQR